MFYIKRAGCFRKTGPALIALVLAANAQAIPTFIGVTGSVQRQTGGNPGTFTVLMNQYYSTLHASVAISVNGGNFREYAMTYDGTVSKNSKWIFTPAALFPANANVKYYFRGWDDAGGSILDGTAASGYVFVASPPTVASVPGDVDVYGANITMGSWLDDLNRPLFYLSTSDGGATSLIRFGASRIANDWIWERGVAGAGSVSMMKLDSSNRLALFDPNANPSGGIVFDPASPQPTILIGGQRVLTTASAAGSYLPLVPVQLAVGVNNTVGADALAVGNSARATGVNAVALGSNTNASGQNSTAIGDHTQAQGLGQFVAGAYNISQGSPNTSDPNDQLFVVGNGTDDSHRSNALTVLRNGNVGLGTAFPGAKLDVNGSAKISGDLKVTGAVTIAPQGDLSMGEFTQGQAP